MRALAVVAGAVLVGCGGSTSPPPEAAPALAIVATPETPDDVQVATVNGRPVWGSCVAHQHKPKDAGLADCIAFELLAQAAEAKGLARDPDTVETARTAMVNRLVETQFEAKVRTVADLGGVFDAVIDRNLFRMHRPDLRTSTYARVALPDKPAPELEARAHAAADQLAAALRDETGLFGVTLREAAGRIEQQAGVHFEYADVALKERDGVVAGYGDVLWSIPEVGRIGGPTRTKWGWDVILWTGGLPAQELTRAQLADEMFPELRRQFFALWVENIRKTLGIAISLDPKQLEDGTGS